MVHSNYKHFEGCRYPTIADRIPPKLTVQIVPRTPSIPNWENLERAAALAHGDKPRASKPTVRVVSCAPG